MKKTLIILSSIVYLNGFAQLNANLDADGNIFQNNTHLQNKLNNQQAALTTFSYSNVRALTEINDPLTADAYPWISPDGLRLYYTSGVNNNQLMFTQRPNATSNFVTPTLIPISTASLSSCWLSNNELDAYVCTVSSLYFTHRNSVSSTFNTPVTISLTGAPSYSTIKGASLNNLQDVLFVTLFSTSTIIAEFARTSSTSFAYVRTLSLPPGYEPRIGQLSKDELTYFVGTKYNSFDPLLCQLTRTSASVAFDANSFQQIQGINDLNFSNNQPSMSDNLEWVAFVRNDTNLWAANELYLAHSGAISCSPVQPSAIAGNTSVTPGSTGLYTVSPVANVTGYIWTLPSGYSGSSTTNSINVTIGNASGTISVVAQNSCGVSPSSSLPITISSSTNTAINHDWVWAKSSNEQYASNYSKDIATDDAGNTYITGTFYSSTIKFGSIVLNKISPSSWDIFIAKYDANGNAIWAKNARVDTPLEECAIATDENNNVYITGSYKSSITFGGITLTNSGGSTTSSFFLVKFDSQGNVIWAKDADYSNTLWVSDLAIDSQGNSYVTGSYSSAPFILGSTTLIDFANVNPFLVKYDSGGNVVWARGFQQNNTNSSASTWSFGIATDALDNIYITGDYVNSSTTTTSFGGISLPNSGNARSMFLVKYDNLGNVIWVETSLSSNALSAYSGDDSGRNIVVDLNNNIIVSGNFTSAVVSFDGFSLSNAVSTNPNQLDDVFLVKYDANGTALWAKRAGGMSFDESTGITCDHFGNIYVSGAFESKPANFGSIVLNKISSTSSPVFIAKYDELGNENWVKYVEKTDGSFAESVGVSSDNVGNVYVTGCAFNNSVFGNTTLTNGGIFIAKLGEPQVGISEIINSRDSFIIYPNPNSGVFNLKYDVLLKDANVKIFNTQGQTIYESNQFVSEINISNQPKGIYFIQINSDKKIINKKVIVQ